MYSIQVKTTRSFGRSTRRSMSDIHPVTVTDIPEEETKEPSVEDNPTVSASTPAKETASDKESQTRILVSIRMTNGMQTSQGNRGRLLYSMAWKDLVALLECPVINVLQIRSDILGSAI